MAGPARDGARAAGDKEGADGMEQELLGLASAFTCAYYIGTLMRGNRE